MAGYITIFDNVIFIEGNEENATIIKDIKCDLGFSFGVQLKNLDDVKNSLVVQAKALNANAVINFKYGQKSRWLALDNVTFVGSGQAIILSDERYQELKDKINSGIIKV